MKITFILLISIFFLKLSAQPDIIMVPSTPIPTEVIPPPKRVYDVETAAKIENQKKEERYLKDSLKLCNEFQHIKKYHKCRNRFGKYGFADINHHLVIGYNYDYLQDDYSSLMMASQGKKFGVINNKEEQIIPFEYESISYEEKGKFYVGKKNWKRYAIDLKGKIIIPEGISMFDEHFGIIYYDSVSKVSYRYNLKGKRIGSYNCRFSAPLSNNKWKILADTSLSGRSALAIGVSDSLCTTVIPAQYIYLDWINKDWAFLYNFDGKTSTLFDIKNQKPHIFDFKNILEPVCEDNFIFFIQGRTERHYGLMNKELKIVIPAINNLILPISCTNFFIVDTKLGNKGIFNGNGEMVLDTVYSYAQLPTPNIEVVENGELIHKWDTTGFVKIGQKINEDFWPKYGLWNASKGLIHQPIYDDLFVLSDSAYVTRKDGLIEVYNLDGKVDVRNYSKIIQLDKLIFETKKTPKTYVILDRLGNETIEIPNLISNTIDNKYHVIKEKDNFALYTIDYIRLTPFIFREIGLLYKLKTPDLQKYLALHNEKNFEDWVAWAVMAEDGSTVLLDNKGNMKKL